jgi:hypothetical protein
MRPRLLAFLAVCACAAPGPKPDLSLLRAWSPQAQRAEPHPTPFVSSFRTPRGELRFIAAKHGFGDEDPTHLTVKKEMETFAPGFLVIEGRAFHGEVSPRWYRELAARSCTPTGAPACGESRFAATLAMARGIPFITGDPPDADIVAGLMKAGYSAEDYAGLSLMQMLPHWNAQGVLASSGPARAVEGLLPALRRDFGLSPEFGYERFRAWHREKLGRELEPQAVTSGDTAPRVDAGATWLHRLCAASDQVRETAIVREIAERAARHERVLVVYGGGHLVKQRKVLEALYGPATAEKPY